MAAALAQQVDAAFQEIEEVQERLQEQEHRQTELRALAHQEVQEHLQTELRAARLEQEAGQEALKTALAEQMQTGVGLQVA